jgi:PKD repeat protein
VDATPVVDLPNIFNEDVTVGGERGLVNVLADPDFASNGSVYVFYTAAVPQRDRVSRLTIVGNTANPASEIVLWQGTADSVSTDHHGGGLTFGLDGRLYISTGDNGDPPSSQPLTSDRGKILRINKDGTIPTDNPFFDGAGPNLDAIWARGLRNPYRFSIDPPSGRMFIGDVGLNTTEEVNLGTAGANYGWPACEGPCGVAGMTNPWHAYSHDGRDAAVTGGFVYRGTQFPASLRGAYFYGDFAQNVLRYLTIDGAGNVSGGGPFLPPDGALDGPYDPVMLKQGPDGSLYYVDFGWGWQGAVNPASIRRIRYVAGNQPPVAAAAATPAAGPAPLQVSFSSSGSVDPEGNPLSFTWTFGDGESSTLPNPVHTFAQSGQFTAQLTVSDGTLTSAPDVIVVAVGTPPQSAILSPADGLVFRAGDVISFSGSGSDAEDGTLPPSALSWTILFHHDSHVHPTLGPLSGLTSGNFTIPLTGHDFSGNTFYEIILTATDSTGLQHSSSVSVRPHKIDLTIVTVPPGLSINLDGISRTTPYVKDTLTRFQHTLEAPGHAGFAFVAWSDGGTQAHTITAGEASATYQATYQQTTVTAFPTSTAVLTGTLAGGTVTALTADDNVYYAVNSTTTGTRIAAWYGAFGSVPNGLTNLRVNYKGNNSGNCTQTIAIWNWSTSAWAQLDSRTVGGTEVAINNLVPTGTLGNYVSGATGNGELRVRVQCQASGNRTSRGDVMSIVYDAPPGPPDTAVPVRTNGQPTGALPVGATQATLSLSTDESATCRYGQTPGVAYASLPTVFTTTGDTAHSTTVTGLSNGGNYNYVVRCQDGAGNANPDDFIISFSVAQDTTAPVRSNGQPTGTLPAGTTQAMLSVITSENATCRFGPTAGEAYASLPNAFSTTGGTSHSSLIAGLANGTSYAYFVRCADSAANANVDDFPITFAVANPPPPDTTAPTVVMNTPANNVTVSGNVTVGAAATDSVGVVGVQFLLDGAVLGAEDTTAPYSIVWNSTTVANGGPYLLSARARDAAGNQATATAVSVMVNNTSLGLIASYSFNEAAGTTLVDQTGLGHTGTVSGATWTTQGRFGSALSFDGVNDWVTIADKNDLDFTTAMTAEAWVYPTANGGGSWRNVLIKERSGGEVYNVYANADTNAPTAYVVRSANPSMALDARGTSQLPLNTWTHVAMTFDNATLRLYVNGVQVGTRAVAGPLLTSTGVLRLGGNGPWGEYFAGRLDEIRLYNRALSAVEIQADMNAPIQP